MIKKRINNIEIKERNKKMTKLKTNPLKKQIFTFSVEINDVVAETNLEALTQARDALTNGFYDIEIIDMEDVK